MKPKPKTPQAQAQAIEFIPASKAQAQACRALKKAGLAKKPVAKEIIPESERIETANKLVAFTIRRIEFPKHGEPFPLSYTDRSDATQAGMMACVETGFFDSGKITLSTFKDIRNAIQSRDCLRLRCNREIATEKIDEIAGATPEKIGNRQRKCQRDLCRRVMTILRASFDTSGNRKRESTFKTRRRFFLGLMNLDKKPQVLSPEKRRDHERDFLDYLRQGAAIMRLSRKPCEKPVANLADSIMQALELRGTAAMLA